MRVKKWLASSAYTFELPKGCVYCAEGRKLVLLVTGLCHFNCFYCPLSAEKRGKDVVYADEMPVKSDEDVLLEAELIGAKGTGITGGDPLFVIEKSVHYIKILKEVFGTAHHIHLYTSQTDEDKIKRLAHAGLDEIRFHPPPQTWGKISNDYKKAIKLSQKLGLSAGFEVPSIPDMKKQLLSLIKSAQEVGADFINLNELEFSETNVAELNKRGYSVKDEISAAVKGSEELAYQILNMDFDIPIHYCSASFKDSIQLRRRIKNRAKSVARPYDIITDDGTLLRGVIEECSKEYMAYIAKRYKISPEYIEFDEKRKRILVAPWVLEEISTNIPYPCYLVEEYPTWDALEVEREPLNDVAYKKAKIIISNKKSRSTKQL
ncbi:MAG: radical SAM protein [Thermoplasmata archaeon]|nr:MAG: radical SAM protein [Thermoplasmata archaeon]